MVSIIKNQLLKHLSRFTKNLSADKINISTLRGEGELSNLELDESVLTDLLELPNWLKITNAWCNKVTIRVQWTKLKSVPIYLNLDEVHVEVVTCEDLRNSSLPNNVSAVPGTTKYSFIHKVIDGITVCVNTAVITFKSRTFVASVQISRIMLESKSPTWQRADLRMTRLKDTDKGQLLIFKELEWQTVRIEAQSTKDTDLTPLRLLTNQARCRITIKKRLSDCLVMGSRLIMILDDLLWVLTDSQLKAALCFLDSLGGLIEKATVLERKVKAARELEILPEYQAQMSQRARSKIECTTAISKIFMRYDVVETSYHFLSQKIDLHLCDDPGTGRSSHPDLSEGGALQISLVQFQIDYYPYHLAIADRKHWAKYNEMATPHAEWLRHSFNTFRSQFMDFVDVFESNMVSKENTANQSNYDQSDWHTENHFKNLAIEQLSTLMTTCIVIRIHDFTIYKVTTPTRKPAVQKFISGDREKLCLPEDVTIVHAEFTYYYIPGQISFPLPPPKFYIQVNPLLINYDAYSCLWLNSFGLNLYQSLGRTGNTGENTVNLPYFDVKLEALLPRIVFEAQSDYPNQRDRPKSMHIQTSRVSITNVRTCEKSSRADLAECLNAFYMGQMFFSTDFPNEESDLRVMTEKLINHSAGTDNVRNCPQDFSFHNIVSQLQKELLWTDSRDVWCCSFEPVWVDFYGARAVGSNRPISFLDAVPITIWLHTTPKLSSNQAAVIHGLVFIRNLISVQIDHYQFLFLLRELEKVSEMNTFLTLDSKRILEVEPGSLIIGALLSQVEVTLIMPSQTPGKENLRADIESFVPDTSSNADEPLHQSMTNVATTAKLEFGSKQLNKSNEAESPQSEVSLVETVEKTDQQVVTFQSDSETNRSTEFSPPTLHRNTSDEFDSLKKNLKIKSRSDGAPFVSNNFNVGLSSMKKGFAHFITSIDLALKPSTEDGSSDTVSIQSELSSDSENYVVVTLEEENADSTFVGLNTTGIPAVEEASEVIEETIETQIEKSIDSRCRREDLVSAITFKLSKIEVVQQTSGFSTVIKLQVAKISCRECSSIPWDELQKKFGTRSRGWVEVPSDSDCKTCIKIRLCRDLNQGVQSEDIENFKHDSKWKNLPSDGSFRSKNGLIVLFENSLKAKINNISLTMAMSSLVGLIDLVEDEIDPDPLPIEILFENNTIRLNDDRTPNNNTSAGPVPVDLVISKLKILRDKLGVFHIDCETDNAQFNTLSTSIDNYSLNYETEKELINLQKMTRQLQEDKDELVRRLSVLDKLSQENYRLKRNQDELENLKSNLSGAQNCIAELLKEKQVLQETAAVLHQQLSKISADSNRNSWSIKR